MTSASCCAFSRGCSSTSVTSPNSNALLPSINAAVMTSCFATSTVINSLSASVPPISGINPQRPSSIDNEASGVTIRISAPRAICSPPPQHRPWIAIMTGVDMSFHPVDTRCARFDRQGLILNNNRTGLRTDFITDLISRPVQKSGPSPDTIITRMVLSLLRVFIGLSMGRNIAMSRPLCLSGRFKRT